MCLEASDIIAISAAVISFCTFIVSFFTLRSFRNHNILTVKPLCSILISDYENKLGVKLKNTGSGPLIITDVLFSKSDGTIIKCLLGILPKVIYTDYTTQFNRKSILPNNSIRIFLIDDIEVIKINKDEIRKILKDVIITVHYTDIYGNKDESERKLGFFGRHSGYENC